MTLHKQPSLAFKGESKPKPQSVSDTRTGGAARPSWLPGRQSGDQVQADGAIEAR